MLVSATSGIALFLGRVKSKEYSPIVQKLKARLVFSKNYWIYSQLSEPRQPDFVESIKTFGAEIICRPSFPHDKLHTDCIVNSQEYLFDTNDNDYDPALASAIKLIDYEH